VLPPCGSECVWVLPTSLVLLRKAPVVAMSPIISTVGAVRVIFVGLTIAISLSENVIVCVGAALKIPDT